MDNPAQNTRSSSVRRKTTRQVVFDMPSPSPRATPDNHNPPTSNLDLKSKKRNTPYLPTPTELALLAVYPSLLLFGALFSLLSPETRSAPYDAARHAHSQDPSLSPSYFARKDNLFNVLFVKRGWAWITGAFFVFLFTHPTYGTFDRKAKATVRWAVVTSWWVFVTQWFFGPAIIDRGFRWTGGKCEVAEQKFVEGAADTGDVFTAAACKASGGRWSGGHDISGHVFLLVLGSYFLVQEVGWVVVAATRRRSSSKLVLKEERSVVMHDGAVKGAGVERNRSEVEEVVEVDDALGYGGKVAAAVVALSAWMLLMTAIYFHTWFEKLTGLLVALAGLYVTYVLPRWVPSLRQLVGLPGI